MLQEVAITPDFFRLRNKESFDQFRLRLRALQSRAARGDHEASPVLVAGLRSCGSRSEWWESAMAATAQIKNQGAQAEARGLLTRFKQLLTLRPPAAARTSSELEWANEAAATHRQEPLTRLFSSTSPKSGSLPVSTPESIEDDQLWKDAAPSWDPSGTLAEQVASLRPLLVHADFLTVQAPHPQEREFLYELARNAFSRPQGFPTPQIEFHSQFKDGQKQGAARSELRRRLPDRRLADHVQWYLWDQLSDRFVLGGRLVPVGTEVRRSVRWGVHMSHLPWSGKKRSEETCWTLLSRAASQTRLERLSNTHDLDKL